MGESVAVISLIPLGALPRGGLFKHPFEFTTSA